MKNIILHDTYLALGIAIHSTDFLKGDRWFYLVPSGSLIPAVKEAIIAKDIELQKQMNIMTFDMMMRSILPKGNKKILTAEEQELIVKRAIEKVDLEKGLPYFKDSIHKTGLVSQVEMWIGEVKRAGISSNQLLELWSEQSQKFRELAYIYDAYQELLNHYSMIDHEEPYLDFLLEDTSAFQLPNLKGIITDQFYDFSPIQMMVLSKMADLGYEVNIHIPIDKARKELYLWNENTINYLKYLGFEDKWLVSKETEEAHINPAIHDIKKYLFSSLTPPKREAKDISIFTLAGQKQELEVIAAEIKKLVQKEAMKLDEIAIIIPKLEAYKEPLKEVMEKAGISIRLGKREQLIKNPFVQAYLHLLKASRGKSQDFVNLIYSPYFKWKKSIAPAKLMNILRELSFPSSKEKWQQRFEGYLNRYQGEKDWLYDLNEVMEQIYDFVKLAPAKGKNKDYVEFLNLLEQEFKTSQVIKNFFMKNPTSELAYRDIKAFEKWQELKQDFLSLDQFLGETETIPLWNWINSLMLASEKAEYDYTQGRKRGVYILAPNQIRGRRFQAVFILGLVNGEFPRIIKNDWLMPDNERFPLRKQGYHLNLSREYENQQKYHFFQSVLSTKEKLYLIYSSKTEEGSAKLRSLFVDELLDLFHPEAIPIKSMEVSDLVPKEWDDCVYDEQLLKKLYYTLTNPEADSEEKNIAASGLEALKTLNPEKIRKVHRRMESDLNRWELESIFDGVLKNTSSLTELKPVILDKVWSTTQLNTAVQCRFAYFSQYILKLTEWEEQEESLSPLEKGDILHRILERFLTRFKSAETKMDPYQEDSYLELLLEIAEEEWQHFNNKEGRYVDPVLSMLDWHRLKNDLKLFLNHEMFWRKKSTSYFYPKYLELSFGLEQRSGDEERVDPESVPEVAVVPLQNRTLKLRGKIDRVDMNEEGKFVVYDYKTGHAPSFKEIKEGSNLQLPLYLLVLDALLGLTYEQAIGASFYTSGTKKDGEVADSRNKGIWKDDFLHYVGISNRIGAKVTEEEWELWINSIKEKLEELLLSLEQGDYAVLPSKDCPSYCSYQYICRKNEERMKMKKQLKEVR